MSEPQNKNKPSIQQKNSISIFEFMKRFPHEHACLEHLSQLKWNKGYVCKKCGNLKYCKASRLFDRQCTKCNYIESPTANTIFHKIKFPLLKAFWIVYYVSSSKKGIATTELSRRLDLRQKTCWLFKRKIMEAMATEKQTWNYGQTILQHTVVAGIFELEKKKKNKRNKQVLFALQKDGNRVSNINASVLTKANAKALENFLRTTTKTNFLIRSNGWHGFKPLKGKYPYLLQKKRKKGERKTVNYVISIFQGWLTGIHHRVDHTQAYINEFCYRYNHFNYNKELFNGLLKVMMNTSPCPYKLILLSR